MGVSPYDDWADIYDSVYSYVVEDIPFYVEEAERSDGPVLELGSGTGRVAIPVALNGNAVVGVDSSSAMLNYARQKAVSASANNLALIESDMRDFDLGESFSLVTIPFNGFLSLLSVEDEIRTLMNVRRHIAPRGRLALDIFVPDLNMLVQEGDIPYHFRDILDPMTQKRLVIWNQSTYDAFSQIMSIRTIIEELDGSGYVADRIYRDYALRYVFRWEMHHLLKACGFDILALYGGFDRREFDESSTEMVWVATPAH